MTGWAKITEFHRPETLEHATELAGHENTMLIAGGTYLLVDRPEYVRELVHIAPLLNQHLVEENDLLSISAGTTVQQLVDSLDPDWFAEFARSAKLSSSSHNLRNQRTIGGELAQKRTDSDLRVALEALNPDLVVAGGNEKVELHDWDGRGIITDITIPVERTKSLRFERYSLLPNAPAFVIVGSAKTSDSVTVAIGGRAGSIGCWTLNAASGNGSGGWIDEAAGLFHDDHTGTRDYKQHLVMTALRRLGVLQ